MTFRKLIMLAGIGGLVYAHRKRGGQMTLDSFKQSGRDFLDFTRTKVDTLKTQAENRIHDVAGKVADKTEAPIGGAHVVSDDVTGYGSSGYGYGTRR